MLIQKLELKNFKRFTDLTIDLSGEKETPKLVLLIGANGSGKSCVFDAFQKCKLRLITTDNPTSYFVKNWSEGEGQYQIIINQNNNYEFNFYGLTAFRYIPSITKSQIGGRTANEYKLFIEEEKDKFDQNIDILFSRLIASLSDKNDNFAQDFETKIKSGFSNIFGNSANSLNFEKYESPIIGQTPVKFLFSKGQSKNIDYSYLSAGEKMIFIILFDLYLNVLGLENTIVYLDELDSHLNTSLQKNLLKEITENWIPDSCQLWTASHSLGFIQYATEYDRGVVIDLDNLDFDITQKLLPRPNDLDVYEIAVPKNILKRIFGDRKIIYVENKNDVWYQLALGDESTIFFPAQNNTDIYNLAKNNHWSIRDRDYLQSYEIKELQFKIPKLKILGYYTFENYL